jgi:hypothetical protein
VKQPSDWARDYSSSGTSCLKYPPPASFLTGASAAAGIAAINSLGNPSGFAGPYAMGYLKDLTASFTAGLLLLAGCALEGAIVVVLLRIDARREQVSGEIAATFRKYAPGLTGRGRED